MTDLTPGLIRRNLAFVRPPKVFRFLEGGHDITGRIYSEMFGKSFRFQHNVQLLSEEYLGITFRSRDMSIKRDGQ